MEEKKSGDALFKAFSLMYSMHPNMQFYTVIALYVRNIVSFVLIARSKKYSTFLNTSRVEGLMKLIRLSFSFLPVWELDQ